MAERARRIPTIEAAFRNLYCNQRVDSEERWLPMPEWKACIVDDLDIEDHAGEQCVGGLDLSSVRDLTAFALYWPKSGTLNVWSWCPADNLREREERDRVPYTVWAKQGFIDPTPGAAVDKRAVAYKLADLCAKYKPDCIAFDRWGITEIQRVLKDEGIELPELKPFGQGYKDMSPATKAFEERVINRTLKTPLNPLLTWSISNVAISRDPADNKKPNKEKSRERIDPAVAAVMAVGYAATSEMVAEPQYQMMIL
jgi:phage terminase large subunit-like protein